MSGTYDLFVLQRLPLAAPVGLRAVHETMVAHGAELNEECLYILEDDDSEPEPVTDAAATMNAIAATPGLGLIQYDFEDVYIDTTYLSAALDGTMDGVLLSVGQLTFEERGDTFAARLIALGRALHEALAGARTVMDWGLSDGGFAWQQELLKAREGLTAGTYTLLDIGRT